MALDKIILISNPGSASRKYALFKSKVCLAEFHFEVEDKKIVYTTGSDKKIVNINHVTFAPTVLKEVIRQTLPDFDVGRIHAIALRIVAPSSFFQRDHLLTNGVVKRLTRLQSIAPLHISATLSEFELLKVAFPKIPFVGVSDSAFLSQKPDKAMYYGLPFKDAEKLDIKRFGYHGISLESVVKQLKRDKKLPDRAIVCHMGGGVTVAAIHKGKVVDSTMGFSPLEGVLMATRSGNVDLLATDVIKHKLRLQSDKIYDYFNARSGLLGVSGVSSDIRELLKLESKNQHAKRALEMYMYKIQQAVGAMAASMNGADALVFTGTIGVRSAEIRKRIVANLLFLGFMLDNEANRKIIADEVGLLSKPSHPARVYVLKTNENSIIAQKTNKLIN